MPAIPTAAPMPAERSPRRGRRPLAILAPIVAFGVLVAACGSSDTVSGPVVKDGVGCKPSEVARSKEVPVIAETTKVGKKVETKDLTVGKGCATNTTDYLSLDLVGATADDGKVFASTWKTLHAITAQLGQGQLLAGLETGLADMKVGGRRQITIPAKDAYGKDGNPSQGIGKDEDLVFVADLVAVTPKPIYCSSASDIPATTDDGKAIKGKPKTVDMPIKVPTTKVITKTVKAGKGEKVGKDRYATVNYLGVSCIDGRQFDSSWDRGEPFTVALGNAPAAGTQGEPGYVGNVIPGWSSGLETARVGGLYQLEIPYPLAYGAQGNPPSIAAYASLVFVVEVISVSDKPPKAATTSTTTTTTAPGATTTTTAAATTTTTSKSG